MTILFIVMAPFAAFGAIAAWFYVSYAIGFEKNPNRQLYLFLKDTRWRGKFIYVPNGKEKDEVIVYQREELPLPSMPPIPEPDDAWDTLIPAARDESERLSRSLIATHEAHERTRNELRAAHATHEQTCAELHGLLRDARRDVSFLKNSLAESSKEADAARGEVLVMTWQDLPRIQAERDATRAELRALRAAISDPNLDPQLSLERFRDHLCALDLYTLPGDP